MPTAAVHTVLIPGLLCSARLYEQLLPAVWSCGGVTLADTRRDSTMTGMARRVLAAAPERFALVGLSMGGYVALEVMRLAPDRVSGLGLISTLARPDLPTRGDGWPSRSVLTPSSPSSRRSWAARTHAPT